MESPSSYNYKLTKNRVKEVRIRRNSIMDNVLYFSHNDPEIFDEGIWCNKIYASLFIQFVIKPYYHIFIYPLK